MRSKTGGGNGLGKMPHGYTIHTPVHFCVLLQILHFLEQLICRGIRQKGLNTLVHLYSSHAHIKPLEMGECTVRGTCGATVSRIQTQKQSVLVSFPDLSSSVCIASSISDPCWGWLGLGPRLALPKTKWISKSS